MINSNEENSNKPSYFSKNDQKRDSAKRKIIMIASTGGHLEEILALKQLSEHYECVLVTEKVSYEYNWWHLRRYTLHQVNRHHLLSIPMFFWDALFSLYIILKEKPNVILSTGAMCAYPMLLFGKLLRKKIIFIECLFNTHDPTLTGKLVYRFADLFIVQWKEMLDIYPKAVFKGRVY